MYTIKKENIYKEEEDCKEQHEQTNPHYKNKNKNIDISTILKDVECCIKSGLDDKLRLFFYKFETYEQMHNEVLNLTVVKNLVNNNMNVNSTVQKRKETILMKKLKKQKKRVILQLKRIAKEKKALEILNNKLDKIRKLHNENRIHYRI